MAEKKTEKQEKVPVSDSPAKIREAKEELQRASDSFKKRLREEPKVKVNGNPMYKTFLGKHYTFMFNDIQVSITFDGKDYEYPETIAKRLEAKLSEIARANTPVDLNERL